MSELKIAQVDNVLVVDSRLVAERLGIQHHNFTQTIYNYRDEVESAFGAVLFQTEPRADGNQGGDKPKYALLTEDQATLLMTFSKNTSQVVKCKVELVKAFSQAKNLLYLEQSIQPKSRVCKLTNKQVSSFIAEYEKLKTQNPAAANAFAHIRVATDDRYAEASERILKLIPANLEPRDEHHPVSYYAKQFGISAIKLNNLLIEWGYQTRTRDHKRNYVYHPTDRCSGPQ